MKLARQGIGGFIAGLALAGVAAAQQTFDLPPANTPDEASIAIEWLIGAIFVVGCLVVAFKPAKRSNLH